ncbi:acyltransferase family protein [Corynebacterium sp. ES2775-CONJ]|uniref:acyltransferase family protein n=1 Tax=Corynebacterium sp. ES2775-CONJ TaxID=2974029 RepID=UPI0037C11A87
MARKKTTGDCVGLPLEQLDASKYRYDLDGLRGLAITFVVIFHVFVGRVSGGVDVFLLLSGYFFLGAQLRYARRPQADPNPFWPLWRTIRRLVPSLALVVALTGAAVYVLTPELRSLNLASQMQASLFYYQNWELAIQGASYGAATSTVSPLQHLWSMAVQGQFYIFAIALGSLVALSTRWGATRAKQLVNERLVLIFLILVTSMSFGYACYLYGVNQQLNYYSTFSRMWELSLGALLALTASRLRLNSHFARLSGIVGVAMVLSTGFLFDGANVFPGPATLYPLGGAALVVISGGAGVSFLAGSMMRFLGRIAYALYLWHWPLLIISTVYLKEEKPGVVLGLGVIVVSLVLAVATHHCVEKPLMQKGKRPIWGEKRMGQALRSLIDTRSSRLRLIGALGVVGCISAALYIPNMWRQEVEALSATDLDPVLYPGAAALSMLRVPQAPVEPDPYVLPDRMSPAWRDGCMSFIGQDPTVMVIDDPKKDCVYGDKKAKKLMVVVGGSHAEQWMAPLDLLGKEHGFRLIPLVRQSCPAFVNERDGVFSKECQTFNDVMVDKLKELNPDIVFSTSTRPLLEIGRRLDEVPKSYPTLWRFLEKEGFAFVGVRDNPWFLHPDGQADIVSQCYAETQDLKKCGRDRFAIYSAKDPAAQYLNKPDMLAIDTADWFCPDGFCPPVMGNIYMYRDANHLSDEFALTLAPLLWKEMGDLVNKVGGERKMSEKEHVATSSQTSTSRISTTTPAASTSPTKEPSEKKRPQPIPLQPAADPRNQWEKGLDWRLSPDL